MYSYITLNTCEYSLQYINKIKSNLFLYNIQHNIHVYIITI